MAPFSKRDGKSSNSGKSRREPQGGRGGARQDKGRARTSSRSSEKSSERSSTRGAERPFSPKKESGRFDEKPSRFAKGTSDDSKERPARGERSTERPTRSDRPGTRSPRGERSTERPERRERSGGRTGGYKGRSDEYRKGGKDVNKPFVPSKSGAPKADDGLMRLNRFLSQAGIASRREADRLIELGLVTVNGQVVKELGQKIDPLKDVVKYDDVKLRPEKMRYVLLNKPKDYITTMDDPKERKTVMALIADACSERIYPVGRLDRATTGLLLFTNDGDLAKRLTHPKHGFPKIYHVETLEKVKGSDIDKIREGIQLEDGFIQADEIAYVGEGNDPHQVGIRIHSGKNRIVRRIFEHFGYTVKKLDRVMFAGLTKKDLPRGRHRHLTDQEVNFLRMIR